MSRDRPGDERECIKTYLGRFHHYNNSSRVNTHVERVKSLIKFQLGKCHKMCHKPNWR